jgi:hypothetical protein
MRRWSVASIAASSRRTRIRESPAQRVRAKQFIRAIAELKPRNPRFGCPRIVCIIARTFGVDIDRNVVRRVLAQHYRPSSDGTGLRGWR